MADWIKRLIWAPIGGVYFFVVATGVSMFFRYYPLGIWWSHAAVGMALAAVSLILVQRYWSLVRPQLLGVFLCGVLAFFIGFAAKIMLTRPAPEQMPTDSTHQILFALTHMPIEQFAPLFGGDAERVAARLREVGFPVESTRLSLSVVARASGRSEREALAALTDLLWTRDNAAGKPQ
jgi:hypothetical protein